MKSCRRKNGIDEGRVVLREKFERVAGLVGRSRTIEAERQMNGLLAGAGGVQIDVLDDLGSHRFAADLGAGAGAEIDRHHIARLS